MTAGDPQVWGSKGRDHLQGAHMEESLLFLPSNPAPQEGDSQQNKPQSLVPLCPSSTWLHGKWVSRQRSLGGFVEVLAPPHLLEDTGAEGVRVFSVTLLQPQRCLQLGPVGPQEGVVGLLLPQRRGALRGQPLSPPAGGSTPGQGAGSPLQHSRKRVLGCSIPAEGGGTLQGAGVGGAAAKDIPQPHRAPLLLPLLCRPLQLLLQRGVVKL